MLSWIIVLIGARLMFMLMTSEFGLYCYKASMQHSVVVHGSHAAGHGSHFMGHS